MFLGQWFMVLAKVCRVIGNSQPGLSQRGIVIANVSIGNARAQDIPAWAGHSAMG